MFQQLLANKHHRLRDSVPITIWPSGGLRLVTDKKKKKKNPVQSKNRARPMAGQLKSYIYRGSLFIQCAVPGNVHTHTRGDQWKFCGDGGVSKAKSFKEKYRGRGIQTNKPSMGVVWIFSVTSQYNMSPRLSLKVI